MKAGDLVYVRGYLHYPGPPPMAIIIRDIFPDHKNKGRGFKIMFSNGQIKNKLAKYLEAV